jgi:hypothetical protein
MEDAMEGDFGDDFGDQERPGPHLKRSFGKLTEA